MACHVRWLVFAVIFLLLAACQERETQKYEPQVEKPAAAQVQEPAQGQAGEKAQADVRQSAMVRLEPTQGNNVRGTVTFTREEGGIKVVADLEGLQPGPHGFHIHEKGDCSAPDATSAGGHYNPMNTPHGAPDNPPDQRHVGDLGNVEAGPEGRAHYERVDQVIQLEGPESILGKAVIVHAKPDDFTTQPTGGAGDRLACGVIEQ